MFINLANISLHGKPEAMDELISPFLPSVGGQGPEQRHFNLIVRQTGRVL